MPKKRLTNDEYEFVFKRVPRLCVDCVVISNEGILLAMREIEPFKGFWALPGGMVKYKETIDQAFARIASCELGIRPTSKKLLGCIEHVEDGPYLHSVSLAYLVWGFEGTLRGSDQGRDLRFFSTLPDRTQPFMAQFFRENWEVIMG